MIEFTCAELLGYNRTKEFWGNAFNPTDIEVYNISARIKSTNITNSLSVWNGSGGVNEIVNGYLDYGPIIVNGVNLGSGRVISINFEEGTDTFDKKYEASFEIIKSGSLWNLNGTYYDDINTLTNINNWQYVRNWSENFSISKEENGITTTNQNLSFEIDGRVSGTNNQNLAKQIARLFMTNVPNLYFFQDIPVYFSGTPNSGFINYYNEAYDPINKRYNFSRNYRNSGNSKATWTYSHSISYNGNDVTVSEQGEIRSIYYKKGTPSTGKNIWFSYLSGANDFWSQISGDIFNRVSGLTYRYYSGYLGMYTGNQCPLFSIPINISYNENALEGTINYSFTYSNNPIYSGSGYSFSNSRSISIGENGYMIITENGSYQGLSPNKVSRFLAASGGYYEGINDISNRVQSAFVNGTGISLNDCPYTGEIFKTSQEETFREFDGAIDYSYVYTNNPNYYPMNSMFSKYDFSLSENYPVHLVNNFLIPNFKEIAQSARNSTEGDFSQSVAVYGRSGGIPLIYYQNEALSKTHTPTGVDVYLKNANSSFSTSQNVYTLNLVYGFGKHRTKNNILV